MGLDIPRAGYYRKKSEELFYCDFKTALSSLGGT
jgi:hypothetical protein